MSTVWVLQHAACETLGEIAPVLDDQGIISQYVRAYQGEAIPREIGAASGLIVMGGPMGVYEQARYPFLRDEIHLINDALRAEKPVLGVCLGSQLLAAALGAAVRKGPQKEIGWYPIRLTAPAQRDALWKGERPSFTALHWHGDVFDLPGGALSLASSDLTPVQAFRYGRNAYGFLFHLEMSRTMIDQMVEGFSDELREAGVEGSKILLGAGDHLGLLQSIGKTVFQRWCEFIQE